MTAAADGPAVSTVERALTAYRAAEQLDAIDDDRDGVDLLVTFGGAVRDLRPHQWDDLCDALYRSAQPPTLTIPDATS